MTGTQIGNYKILEKLGEGGMGVVYKAVDINLDRTVAIKALNTELTGNPELEQRFRAEAKAQANLNHTNLATLYALLIEGGRPWMVMEYIEGETFEQMVQRRGPIPGIFLRPFKSSAASLRYNCRTCAVEARSRSASSRRERLTRFTAHTTAAAVDDVAITRSQCVPIRATVASSFWSTNSAS